MIFIARITEADAESSTNPAINPTRNLTMTGPANGRQLQEEVFVPKLYKEYTEGKYYFIENSSQDYIITIVGA